MYHGDMPRPRRSPLWFIVRIPIWIAGAFIMVVVVVSFLDALKGIHPSIDEYGDIEDLDKDETSLSVVDCRPEWLTEINTVAPDIQIINMRNGQYTIDHVRELQKFTNLQHLFIDGAEFADLDVLNATLDQLASLESISVVQASGLRGGMLKFPKRQTGLRSIIIEFRLPMDDDSLHVFMEKNPKCSVYVGKTRVSEK